MRRAIALGAAVAVAACGGARPAPPATVARAPLAAPRVVQGELDAGVLLGDVPAKATKLGAGPLSIVAQGEVVEGERIGAFVELAPDACLLAYARGSSSIEDIDVAAFDDEGNPVAIDEAPDPKPTVLLCPPHPARVYVAAHVANGEGLVGIGAQIVPRERAGDVGRALGAHGGFGEGPRPAEAWPGLDDHVRAHREALGGTWEEIRRVAVTLDARAATSVALPVEADRCVDALLVPDDEVALLEVEALDEGGRVVARAREGGSDRSITLCSPIAFNGSLSVRPHSGRGLAAIVVARARASQARDFTARPDTLWTVPSSPLPQARAEREAALGRAGYGPPTSVTTGQLAMGRRASIPLDLRAPGCARIDVTAGAPLALIDARVWDAKGGLVTSGDGAWGATVFACAHGAARLDLETRGRPGPFAMSVRPERWKDAAFAAHPLAAARMLARAAEGPMMLLEGAPTAARAVTLDASKLIAWDETVAAGQCVQVAAGAEGEGTGLELRLFDAATSAELDRSHAEHAVAARACAPPTAGRPIRAELRATSGKVDAVVGVRTM